MRTVQRILVIVLMTLLFSSAAALAKEKDVFSTSPRLNNGKRWRIGYYEGGQYADYCGYLIGTARALMELGWLEKTDIAVEKSKDTRVIWEWLARKTKSQYIEYVEDAFYSASWDKEKRPKVRAEIIQRLNNKKDIDLMFAMGTWAGKDLACADHSVPTMIMSSSDPLKAAIIQSIEDSGYDHVHTRVDPYRYERQVRLFHDVIGFKKLGVAYEDSVYGRSYAGIDMVEKVARERGFEVAPCYTMSDIADQNLAGESVIKCFHELADKVDAIYVTSQGGVNIKTIPELVKITNESRLPTFSQSGSEEVRYGVLMTISRAEFKPVGMFHAATMAKIFNGAKPRQLNQFFEEAPNIAINLKTAEIIGLYLYADVLAAADEIHRGIVMPE